MNILFLLCLFAINPPKDISPTIHIDGFIEINHFWTVVENPPRQIKNIDVAYGKIVFDQLIIWKYEPNKNEYRIVHWEMIKFGRKRSLLEDKQEIKEQHEKELFEEWEAYHKTFVKFNNIDTDTIVVYIDSQWVGVHDLYNRPVLNGRTNKYELFIRDSDGNAIKIVVPTLTETNTLYDPETQHRGDKGIGPGGTKTLTSILNKKR